MSRILVYRFIDIQNKSDYYKMIGTFSKKYNGACPNFGNKLWYQGIISEISTVENEIYYYNPSMSIELINESYDLLLYPMANIFSVEYASALTAITEFINSLRIPVFIISCGAQANSYDDLDDLVYAIGATSRQFIKAVYNSGGDFALRGYFTADFFSKLGFKHPNVVGCPSLFQLGQHLKISNDKEKKEDFKIAVNGIPSLALPLLKKYNSLFYDQDKLFNILYNSSYYEKMKKSIQANMKWLRGSGFGAFLPELILSDRIRLLADMWDWQDSLQNEGFCFSFGTRIHGSIIAILSGLQTVIVNVDSRVKEMAEFYNIPHIDMDEAKEYADGKKDMYDLYLQTDYSNFNETYPQKYRDFNDFLVRCGIVKEINNDNPYWGISTGDYPRSAITEAKKKAKEVQDKLWLYRLMLR